MLKKCPQFIYYCITELTRLQKLHATKYTSSREGTKLHANRVYK
jgi:hypothetical protein